MLGRHQPLEEGGRESGMFGVVGDGVGEGNGAVAADPRRALRPRAVGRDVAEAGLRGAHRRQHRAGVVDDRDQPGEVGDVLAHGSPADRIRRVHPLEVERGEPGERRLVLGGGNGEFVVGVLQAAAEQPGQAGDVAVLVRLGIGEADAEQVALRVVDLLRRGLEVIHRRHRHLDASLVENVLAVEQPPRPGEERNGRRLAPEHHGRHRVGHPRALLGRNGVEQFRHHRIELAQAVEANHVVGGQAEHVGQVVAGKGRGPLVAAQFVVGQELGLNVGANLLADLAVDHRRHLRPGRHQVALVPHAEDRCRLRHGRQRAHLIEQRGDRRRTAGQLQQRTATHQPVVKSLPAHGTPSCWLGRRAPPPFSSAPHDRRARACGRAGPRGSSAGCRERSRPRAARWSAR